MIQNSGNIIVFKLNNSCTDTFLSYRLTKLQFTNGQAVGRIPRVRFKTTDLLVFCYDLDEKVLFWKI